MKFDPKTKYKFSDFCSAELTKELEFILDLIGYSYGYDVLDWQCKKRDTLPETDKMLALTLDYLPHVKDYNGLESSTKEFLIAPVIIYLIHANKIDCFPQFEIDIDKPISIGGNIDYILEKLPPIVEKLRKLSPLYKG